MLVSNATLTEISDPGGVDDYDAPTIRTPRWSGAVDAYLDQTIVRVTTAAGSENQKRWTVYLAYNDPPVEIGPGDLLTLVQRRPNGVETTYTVPVLEDASNYEPDMPDDVQSRQMLVEPTAP